MNANYAYQQGLLEGAGLTQNQPKRKLFPMKTKRYFRKKGYKKFNPSANLTEGLSKGEENQTVSDAEILQPSNNKSITGDNTLGTIHTSQEVVDPLGHPILSPKRERLDRHDHLWPVDPTWSRSVIPMKTDHVVGKHTMMLTQADIINHLQFNKKRYSDQRSSGNKKLNPNLCFGINFCPITHINIRLD
jgi:hypothetical protein